MTDGVAAAETIDRVWSLLAGVSDPEIPVISVVDLGIVRSVECVHDGIEIGVTPTYTGCPATHVIERDILEALSAEGINARLVTRLDPPWTTDWITPRGRERLAEYGIAPPVAADRHAARVVHLVPRGAVLSQSPACPQCGSTHTELLSQFGSTACKALYRCTDCREPFDYFKPL